MSDLTLNELEQGDRISIDTEPLAGPLWRVSDTAVKDLGIMEIPIVTAVSESEGWLLTKSESVELSASRVDGSEEHHFSKDAIKLES